MKITRLAIFTLAVSIFSCSEDETVNSTPINLSISNTGNADGCESATGSISATATGGSGDFTYSIDNTTFQENGNFTDLLPGVYEITARDETGNTAKVEATVQSGVSLSNAIIPIIEANCAVSNCHDGSGSIPNFSDKSTIIARATGIKTRTETKTMPPAASGMTLTDEQIALIGCWVNDGAVDN